MDNRVLLSEIWTPEFAWETVPIDESNESEVDGISILGRIRGQFFAPGGTSRNGRVYPKELWEKVLSDQDIVEKLSHRLMYGSIGHDDRPVTEAELRAGLVSHIVTKLWIEGNRGMGEALILNTEAGRNLNTYFRAKSRLSTSSRASGKYAEGGSRGGVPTVDPESYILETFDFVLEPGFTQAKPDLVENKEEYDFMDKNASSMEATVMEDLARSRTSLQTRMSELLMERDVFNEQVTKLRQENETLRVLQPLGVAARKLQLTEDDLARVPRLLEDFKLKSFADLIKFLEGIHQDDIPVILDGGLRSKVSLLEDFQTRIAPTPDDGVKAGEVAVGLLEDYKKLGTPKKISESMDRAIRLLEAYKVLGSPKEARKVMEDAERVLGSYTKLGTPKSISESMTRAHATLTKVRELGSLPKITKAMTEAVKTLTAYREIGSPGALTKTITEAREILERIKVMGGIDKIEDVRVRWNTMMRERKEKAMSEASEKLSTEYGIPVTEVRGLVESVGYARAKKLVSSLSSERFTSRRKSMDESIVSESAGRREGLVSRVFQQASSKMNG